MNLHLTSNRSEFMIFIHNKGHMFLQRGDRIFGSEYIILQKEELKKHIKNGTDYTQTYEIKRTYWESLNSEEKRCDNENKNHATRCITNFLENLIGCSIGMAESGMKLERCS